MSNPETVKVGDGATQSCGSDSYPHTVIEVNATGKTITVQEDTARATNDSEYYGNQEYTYQPNPNGQKRVWTWRKKHACYYPKGCASPRKGGFGLHVNDRRYYQDPSF